MIYLLDTHVFLWTIADITKLSKTTYSIIENNENTILVSSVSLWEISLKYALGKMNLIGLEPQNLIQQAKDLGYELIPLLPEEASKYLQLNTDWHKDPFDRMLIWQAINRNVTLICRDGKVAKYSSAGLKAIW